MIAEAFGVQPDRLGENPHVVMDAFDNDAEMPTKPLFALLNLSAYPVNTRFQPVKPSFQAIEPSFQAIEPRFQTIEPRFQAIEPRRQAVKPAFQPIEAAIDTSEASVHRTLELADSHRLTRSAHLSIVTPAKTMPSSVSQILQRV